MRRFLAGLMKAIGEALRSMGQTVWTKCRSTGRWLAEWRPSLGIGGPLSEEEPVKYEAQGVMPAGATDGIERLRAAAEALASGHHVTSVFDDLSDFEIRWLSVLDSKQLLSVARAATKELRAHLSGRHSISDLTPFDPASVAELKRVQTARPPDPDNELEPECSPRPVYSM